MGFRFVYLLIAVFIAATLQSCGGRVTGGGAMLIYIPYVEDVVVPDVITAGEPFQMQIRISAQLDQSVLNEESTYVTTQGSGINYILGRNNGTYNNGGFAAFAIIENFSGNIPDDGNRREVVTISRLIAETGPYSIYVPSARTRELGGSALEVSISEGGGFTYPSESDLIEYREIVVNVLPAE